MIYKNVKNFFTIFRKQRIDIFRNKKILLMFLIFPLMGLFYKIIASDGEQLSGMIFLVMNIIMPPITCMASTICEEREKGTLRCLIFSGVNPLEYFCGTGLCLGMFCFIGTCIVAMIYESAGSNDGLILGISGVAILGSMLVGAIIGLLAKNQVSVAPLAAPISLVLGMSAILGMTNDQMHSITQYIYTQAIIDIIIKGEITLKQVICIIVNFTIFFLLFIVMYMKKKRVD